MPGGNSIVGTSGGRGAGQAGRMTAHGQRPRALVKHRDRIGDDDIAGLNITAGMPLVYRRGDDLTPNGPGEYLDPEAAAQAAAAVANQGR